MKLLSIDPGKTHYAWACFGLNDDLRICGRVGDWTRQEALTQKTWGVGFNYCIIELPQIYRQRKWKGDPNDLIQVALTVGALEALVSCPVKLVKPHEWKGSVPKGVMGDRIVDKLSEGEKKILQEGTRHLGVKKHDVIDAVGIGLWALGRL